MIYPGWGGLYFRFEIGNWGGHYMDTYDMFIRGYGIIIWLVEWVVDVWYIGGCDGG